MKDTAVEVAKLSPPSGVVGLSFVGIPLQEWVYLLTIFYTLLLVLDKLFPEVLASLRAWLASFFRKG